MPPPQAQPGAAGTAPSAAICRGAGGAQRRHLPPLPGSAALPPAPTGASRGTAGERRGHGKTHHAHLLSVKKNQNKHKPETIVNFLPASGFSLGFLWFEPFSPSVLVLTQMQEPSVFSPFCFFCQSASIFLKALHYMAPSPPPEIHHHLSLTVISALNFLKISKGSKRKEKRRILLFPPFSTSERSYNIAKKGHPYISTMILNQRVYKNA